MRHASELGLAGTIALCVQTKTTGVGSVMRQIVAAAEAAEEDNGKALPATHDDVATTEDGDNCSLTKTKEDLLERAMVARRVMAEGRGLVKVERAELLEFLAKAGYSDEQKLFFDE